MYEKRFNNNNAANFNRPAPVKEGEELDVKIEAIGEKGDGIAKKDGFVLVVPGTQLNDEVRIRVTKVIRKVGFAEVLGKSKKKEAAAEEESEDEEAAEEEMSEDEEISEDEESSDEEDEEFSDDFGEEEQ